MSSATDRARPLRGSERYVGRDVGDRAVLYRCDVAAHDIEGSLRVTAGRVSQKNVPAAPDVDRKAAVAPEMIPLDAVSIAGNNGNARVTIRGGVVVDDLIAVADQDPIPGVGVNLAAGHSAGVVRPDTCAVLEQARKTGVAVAGGKTRLYRVAWTCHVESRPAVVHRLRVPDGDIGKCADSELPVVLDDTVDDLAADHETQSIQDVRGRGDLRQPDAGSTVGVDPVVPSPDRAVSNRDVLPALDQDPGAGRCAGTDQRVTVQVQACADRRGEDGDAVAASADREIADQIIRAALRYGEWQRRDGGP